MPNGKLIGQGRTADVYEYEEGKILKLYHQDFPIDAIQQEYELSKWAFEKGITTPKPHALIESDSRMGIIFEQVEGSTLLTMMLSDSESIEKYATTFGALHWDIHRFPADSAKELLGDQKNVLKRNIQHAPLINEEEKERIIHYLEGLKLDNKLCHGDFHPDNVLVGKECVTIDWMTGIIGNPAGDVARTIIMLSYGALPENTPEEIVQKINSLRVKIKDYYLNQYVLLSGIDIEEVHKWMLPVAAARLTESLPDVEKQNLVNLIREKLSQ